MGLDSILEDLGPFGKYQIINNILLGLPVLFSVFSGTSFVFTAGDLDYRCNVPACDNVKEQPQFEPKCLNSWVPYNNEGKPSKCKRYSTIANSHNVTRECCSTEFITDQTERCQDWIFKDEEKTILTEFHLMCEENKWKLTLVGTLNNIGQFVALPFAGMISDAYGRRFYLVTGTLLCVLFGTLRAFSTSYAMFLTLEFLDSVATTGVYAAGFILGLELVAPSKRALASTIMNCLYPVGEVILGLAMWQLRNWRHLLLALYLPGLSFASYFWVVPESIRWLAMKKRYPEVISILRRIEIVNKKKLLKNLENEVDLEMDPLEKIVGEIVSEKNEEATSKSRTAGTGLRDSVFCKLFKSRVIMWRVLNCSFCWFTNYFVYYGITLMATELAENKYWAFIAVCFVEIPAAFLPWLLMDKYGRRYAQSMSLCLCGCVCVVVAFIPPEMFMVSTILYLTGKFMIGTSFNILYVCSVEMFPTEFRQSLFSTCSMLGKVGSIIAPQTPLLATYFGTKVPFYLFGAMSLTSGFLAMFFPETLNKKLPDTVDEAANMSEK